MSEEKIEVAVPETEEKTENVMETIVHDPNAQIITLKKLLEAGVHYGHQTKKWNPKMKPFIYCPRNGIFIIDLNKSKEGLEASYLKLKEIVEEGGKVLFVGTKDQTKEIIEEQALRSGSFYITNRWLGGILTNFKTIQTRIRKLKELEASELEGAWATLPKKEAAALRKEKEKLSKNLEGIKEMRKIPNALVVVDPTSEYNAVREANKLNIPVFALCDTNCNPEDVDYVIPGNDDAIRAIKLIASIIADAVIEAQEGKDSAVATEEVVEETAEVAEVKE